MFNKTALLCKWQLSAIQSCLVVFQALIGKALKNLFMEDENEVISFCV